MEAVWGVGKMRSPSCNQSSPNMVSWQVQSPSPGLRGSGTKTALRCSLDPGLPEPGCPRPVGGCLRLAVVSNLGQPALEGTGSDLWGCPAMPVGVPRWPVRVPSGEGGWGALL